MSFSEWDIVVGDAKITAALRQWLAHRCHIIDKGNLIRRFKHSSAQSRLAKSTQYKPSKGATNTTTEVDLSTIEYPKNFLKLVPENST